MKFLVLVFLITLQSAISRFLALNRIPPVLPEVVKWRIITAVVSLLTVLILIFIVRRLFKDSQLALLAGFWLSILPWHIEQGRINSPYPLVLLILLTFLLFFVKSSNKLLKLISTLVTLLLIFLIKPFWFQKGIIGQFKVDSILNNFFKLLSFEFLFFKNDSFWKGGFRNYGAIFPETVPIFLIGIYLLIQKTKIAIYLLGWVILLTLIASLNSQFPEDRTLFLATPFFALILAFGTKKLHEFFTRVSLVFKIIGLLYMLLVFYGLMQFTHFYLVHYNLQVKEERLYESERF